MNGNVPERTRPQSDPEENYTIVVRRHSVHKQFGDVKGGFTMSVEMIDAFLSLQYADDFGCIRCATPEWRMSWSATGGDGA